MYAIAISCRVVTPRSSAPIYVALIPEPEFSQKIGFADVAGHGHTPVQSLPQSVVELVSRQCVCIGRSTLTRIAMAYPANRRASPWVLDEPRPNPIPGKSLHVYRFHRYGFSINYLLGDDLWNPYPLNRPISSIGI
jgi:hypothetical protein